MKRWLVGFCFFALFLSVTAAEEARAPVLNSVDLALSNDFPLGVYQEKTSYNLGLSIQGSARLPQLDSLYGFMKLENAYWLATPAWISFGTQVNGLFGLGYIFPLTAGSPDPSLALRAQLGYGFMAHFVTANTDGKGPAPYAFWDQVFELALALDWKWDSGPLGAILQPRFLVSPEQSSIKQQFGVLVGLKIEMAPTPPSNQEVTP